MRSIIDHLVARGWIGDRIVNCAVTKLFPTAVGPKQAAIWIFYDPEDDRHYLTGQYQSEGRNALSTCWGSIANLASQGDVIKAVHDYLANVEEAIGETYAARLLKLQQASTAD